MAAILNQGQAQGRLAALLAVTLLVGYLARAVLRDAGALYTFEAGQQQQQQQQQQHPQKQQTAAAAAAAADPDLVWGAPSPPHGSPRAPQPPRAVTAADFADDNAFPQFARERQVGAAAAAQDNSPPPPKLPQHNVGGELRLSDSELEELSALVAQQKNGGQPHVGQPPTLPPPPPPPPPPPSVSPPLAPPTLPSPQQLHSGTSEQRLSDVELEELSAFIAQQKNGGHPQPPPPLPLLPPAVPAAPAADTAGGGGGADYIPGTDRLEQDGGHLHLTPAELQELDAIVHHGRPAVGLVTKPASDGSVKPAVAAAKLGHSDSSRSVVGQLADGADTAAACPVGQKGAGGKQPARAAVNCQSIKSKTPMLPGPTGPLTFAFVFYGVDGIVRNAKCEQPTAQVLTAMGYKMVDGSTVNGPNSRPTIIFPRTADPRTPSPLPAARRKIL